MSNLLRYGVFTNRNWKIRILQALNHIGLVFALIYVHEPLWWMAAVFVYFMMFCVGIDIGVHRYFSHQSFKTSRFNEILFFVCTTLATVGSPLAWIGMHRKHHRFSDTAKDPHSPLDEARPVWGFLKAYLGAWNSYSAELRYIRDVRKSRLHQFFHFYYFLVILVYAAVLFTIGWKAVLFLYCVPAVFSFHAASMIVSVGHLFGKAEYETRDSSRNSLLVHWLTWGEGLHNHHHAFPAYARYTHPNPLFFDLPGFLIERVFARAGTMVCAPMPSSVTL